MHDGENTQVIPLFGDQYQPDYFVESAREDEIYLVAEKVEQARAGSRIRAPLVSFWGVAGIGKTWLLKHLYQTYRYQTGERIEAEWEQLRPTVAIYFSFEAAGASIEPTCADLVKALADALLQELSDGFLDAAEKRALQQAGQHGDCEEFVTAVSSLAENKLTPVFLFDAIEGLDTKFLSDLETLLMAPLLATDQIIIVLSGRRRVPRWNLVEVRRRLTASARSQVSPFNLEEIRLQYQRRGLPEPRYLADTLYDLTAGNPLLAARLSQFVVAWAQQNNVEDIESINLNDLEPQIITLLVEYQDSIFQHISARLASYLNALMPLRFYRTEALRYMAGQSDLDKHLTDVKLLRILRDLDRETHIVWWSDSQNAYVTAPVARQVINQRLLLEDREKFVANHQTALDLYWQWCDRYPENSAVYLTEICFHQATIDHALNKSQAKLTDFDRLLNHYENLEFDKRVILPQKLNEDAEIIRLLTPDLFADVLQQLNATLDK